MDTSSVLWTNWHEQLKELLTGIHGHRRKHWPSLSWALSCRGVIMQRVAETLSGTASVRPR